jgi:hypothetical protein
MVEVENVSHDEPERLEKMAIDHEYTNEIVCPYCGAEFLDSWELGAYDILECDCGKKFISTRNTEVTYTTEKIPCMNGETPHVWHSMAVELDGNVLYKDLYRCRECTTERKFPGETRTEFEAFDE